MQRQDALLGRIDAALQEIVRRLGGLPAPPFPPLDGGVFADLVPDEHV